MLIGRDLSRKPDRFSEQRPPPPNYSATSRPWRTGVLALALTPSSRRSHVDLAFTMALQVNPPGPLELVDSSALNVVVPSAGFADRTTATSPVSRGTITRIVRGRYPPNLRVPSRGSMYSQASSVFRRNPSRVMPYVSNYQSLPRPEANRRIAGTCSPSDSRPTACSLSISKFAVHHTSVSRPAVHHINAPSVSRSAVHHTSVSRSAVHYTGASSVFSSAFHYTSASSVFRSAVRYTSASSVSRPAAHHTSVSGSAVHHTSASSASRSAIHHTRASNLPRSAVYDASTFNVSNPAVHDISSFNVPSSAVHDTSIPRNSTRQSGNDTR